jgi:hypothetical protein
MYLFKNKIIFNFVKFTATKKVGQLIFPLLCFVGVRYGIRDSRSGIRDPGSEIRDPRSGIRDPGSEIRYPVSGIIRDPRSEMEKKIRGLG